MSKTFNLIELDNKDAKRLQIYESELPPEKSVYGIDYDSSSDLSFKDKFVKLQNYFYGPTTIMGTELKFDREDSCPLWIMASEMSPENQAQTTHNDRGEAIAAYILLVLHTNKTQSSGVLDEANESVIHADKRYGEIVAFDIRDKYLSYNVIEALQKRAAYILWKHDIKENNKYRFI